MPRSDYKHPRNVQAVMDWIHAHRPDLVSHYDMIFEPVGTPDPRREAMGGLVLMGFEAGREFQIAHPQVKSGSGYLVDEMVEDLTGHAPSTPKVDPDAMSLREALDVVLNKENLADRIYHVRDHAAGQGDFEGNSWDHPRVKKFSDAVTVLKQHLESLT